jgi:hypothetical protein
VNHDITGNLINVACRVVMQEPNAVQSQNQPGHVIMLRHSTCQLEKASAKFKNILRTFIYLYIAQEANSKPHSVLTRSRATVTQGTL